MEKELIEQEITQTIIKYLCKVLPTRELINLNEDITKIRNKIKKLDIKYNGISLGIIDDNGDYKPIIKK